MMSFFWGPRLHASLESQLLHSQVAVVRVPLPPEQTVQSNRCGNQKKGKSEKKKKRAKALAKETKEPLSQEEVIFT